MHYLQTIFIFIIHLSVHLFVHSFIHSFIKFIRSFIHAFIHSYSRIHFEMCYNCLKECYNLCVHPRAYTQIGEIKIGECEIGEIGESEISEIDKYSMDELGWVNWDEGKRQKAWWAQALSSAIIVSSVIYKMQNKGASTNMNSSYLNPLDEQHSLKLLKVTSPSSSPNRSDIHMPNIHKLKLSLHDILEMPIARITFCQSDAH